MENSTACDQALNFTLCWSDDAGGVVGLSTQVTEGGSGKGGGGPGGGGDEEGVEEGVVGVVGVGVVVVGGGGRGRVGGGGGGGGGVGGGGGGGLLGISSPDESWQSIREELQWAFPVHIYGFSCLFFMLAFYTFFSILNLRSQISSRPFMSTINVFLCVLGVTRAACFLIEPYTSGQVMPGFLGSFMWDVGFPCILSAFSLIQLAFSQLTQVKFRPEWLRRKSALSLLITSHFALVFGSDIATAFENHLQVVRWIVQSVFLSWGLVLCVTFLYGGAHIIKLLRTIPQNAFQEGMQSCSSENNKGILQLALLAQCNNIASSVLTAAAATSQSATAATSPAHATTVSSTPSPQPMTPKIRITDEFDQTFSYGSDIAAAGCSSSSSRPSSSSNSSSAATAAALLLQSAAAAAAAESGGRTFDVSPGNITEEEEEGDAAVELGKTSAGVKSKGSKADHSGNNHKQHQNGHHHHHHHQHHHHHHHHQQHQPSTSSSTIVWKSETKKSTSPIGEGSKNTEVKDHKSARKGSHSNFQVKKSEDTKLGDIIIKVEEVDSGDNEHSHDEETKLMIDDDDDDDHKNHSSAAKESGEMKATEPKRKERVKEISKFKKYDSLRVKKGMCNIQAVKSLDSLLLADNSGGKSGYGNSGDTVRRGSYTEGVTNCTKAPINKRKESLPNGDFAKTHLKPDGEGKVVPKRKKSLTWSEDTQTIECPPKEAKTPSRKNSTHEDCDKILRDNHRKSSVSSRRNSRTYGSEKCRVRNNRANEFSDLIVMGGGVGGPGGRRRSSTVSSCSMRKGSEQWQTTLAFPHHQKEHRSLSVSSAVGPGASSSRRSSRKSLRDDAEVEALLDRSPGGQDLTLASILNHIAYVNQAASASKLPRPIKDSRKAQVQQVLIVTYVTAVLGTVLSLALVYRVYGYFSSGVGSATAAAAAAAVLPNPPWLWFTYESGCRFLEFLMGCAMANITRQPLNSTVTRRHSQYHPNSLRLKQRSSLYNI
ncbi:uncharacterized protein [Macrobrachium rosenbergii]|uniref:uncharacterized protein isoform X1 n=1 Tax=Macrobrachium rosenbergii TaxID=79674 RepID=UPI0034D4CC30